MPDVHRIRRLRWRVRTGSRDAAFETRARLRELHKAELLQVFERAFDAAGTGETIVHLQRLELTIRVASVEEISAAVTTALAEQSVRQEGADHLAPPAGAGQTPAGVEGLIHYLRTGILPWALANRDRTATVEALTTLARTHSTRIAAHIPKSLDRAIAYVFRWLQVAPSAEWAGLASLIGAPASAVIAEVEAVAASASGTRPPLLTAPPHLVAALILAVVHLERHAVPVAREEVRSRFAAMVSSDERQRFAEATRAGASPDNVVMAWFASRLGAAREDLVQKGSGRSHIAIEPTLGVRSADVAALPSPSTTDAAPATNTSSVDAGAGLVVDHAGLVLLHPFVPRLLERLGVVAHGAKVIDPSSLPRAAALLAYAAVGDDRPLDFELGLIKVLLGLRPDSVVLTPAGTLGTADRDEVDLLLHSVVEHWKVLKHTSISGLRNSFLQRRGLLTTADTGWCLRVEPDSFDMLIDRLPWGLGPIKLPWMTTLLFTEWARS
ncbi:MAG TPA: contractile injection system tape measure protein [Vicinamibacterales bacterium]|nr:contractile injection system tape measure protein [Vicinamibacterales bacterium]